MSEDLIQAPADRDADEVRSPEDERTLGQIACEAHSKFLLLPYKDPYCAGSTNPNHMYLHSLWEHTATAVRDKVMEWKTIETAPKDGEWGPRVIVGWAQYPETVMIGYFGRFNHQGNGDLTWRHQESREPFQTQPTHWMPLPSPPCVPDRRD